MKKYKYLLKNIGLLTVSNFASKILSFLLVPLYTSILTTKEYGVYDIFNTTVLLLIPIFTIDIVDAVLRFSLDDKVDNNDVYTIGNILTFVSTLILGLFLMINFIFDINQILKDYTFIFLGLYFFSSYNQFLQYYARGIDKVSILSISGVIATAVNLSLNILFLLVFKLGLRGYFYSTILGLIIPTIYLIVKLDIWQIKFSWNKNLFLEMKRYSQPLVLNSISWWINNSSSRYIVIFLCGVAENGIFSIGYKIPSILTVFQSIFNQAWTLSSVKEFNQKDEDGFFSKVYNLYNFSMVILCSGLILTTKLFASFLYAKDFYVAWKYVPFLMIAVVFSALSGLLGGVFSAVKDSKAYSVSTTIGAIINILVSFVGVYFFGPIGAAFGNAVSFIIVWIVRLKKALQYISIDIRIIRDSFAYGLLFLQSYFMLTIENNLIQYIVQICCIVVVFYMYKDIIDQIRISIKRRKNGKN